MIAPEGLVQTRRLASRSRTAAQRAAVARASLANCQFCAHHCGVNRLVGERGPCHAGSAARFFSAQVEVADELELVPAYALALSGCDLRCDFCITGAPSWNPSAGRSFDPQQSAERAARALARGARTIMILGGEPTIHLHEVLELVAALPDTAILVWKTNGHGSAEARQLLEGVFDVWVVDYKFGNDTCARRLAKVDDYLLTLQENLRWAKDHSELIVRHLVMPEHIDCCWRPIAAWLSRELPETKVSLRGGFWPGWQSGRHPELKRTTTASESHDALGIAHELNLRLIE